LHKLFFFFLGNSKALVLSLNVLANLVWQIVSFLVGKFNFESLILSSFLD
jgi:hypothetical protein